MLQSTRISLKKKALSAEGATVTFSTLGGVSRSFKAVNLATIRPRQLWDSVRAEDVIVSSLGCVLQPQNGTLPFWRTPLGRLGYSQTGLHAAVASRRSQQA